MWANVVPSLFFVAKELGFWTNPVDWTNHRLVGLLNNEHTNWDVSKKEILFLFQSANTILLQMVRPSDELDHLI